MKKFNLKKMLSKKMNRKQRRILVFFLVKLGFKDLPVDKRLTKARHIVKKMTGNANFPSPFPSLAAVADIINALAAAQVALDGSKIKTTKRNIALKALNR